MCKFPAELPVNIIERFWWLIVALALAVIVVVSGCSTTSERFDNRPDLCRDLGKRGKEC